MSLSVFLKGATMRSYPFSFNVSKNIFSRTFSSVKPGAFMSILDPGSKDSRIIEEKFKTHLIKRIQSEESHQVVLSPRECEVAGNQLDEMFHKAEKIEHGIDNADVKKALKGLERQIQDFGENYFHHSIKPSL